MGKHLDPDQNSAGDQPVEDTSGIAPGAAVPAPTGESPAGWSSAAPAPVGPVSGGGGLAVMQGLALGVVAAAAGATLWTVVMVLTGYQIGFAAIALGAVVGLAVRVGSRGTAGTGLRVASVGITLVAMAASEVFYERQMFIRFLEAEGLNGPVPVFLPLPDMAEIVVEVVAADPLTLVFWAIAAFASWRLAAP